jgi:hypothetical protein
MTRQRKLPAWMTSRAERKPYLVRLNIILRAAYTDLRRLTNGDWEQLLDDLYFAIFNAKREGESAKLFAEAVKDKVPVWEALEYLKKQLEDDEPTQHPILRLKLDDVTLVVELLETYGESIFGYRVASKKFATMLFFEFANMLNVSIIGRKDFRQCAHCTRPFFPLRRPAANTAAYCSNRCARIVAARNYRKNKAAKKKKTKKKPK